MARRSKSDEIERNRSSAGDEPVGAPKKTSAKTAIAESAQAIAGTTTEQLAADIDDADVEADASGKRQERALIFHLLYAAEGFEYHESLEAIVDNFNRGFEQDIAFDSDAFKIAQAVIQSRDELDEAITPFLSNWRFERISVCTKLILRLAFWELLNTETPPVIIINEAIELTKCFAEADAYRFVNGVLDGFLKRNNQSESSLDTIPSGITRDDRD